MGTVLAAIDTTAAAEPVLRTAVAVARLLHADVRALHAGCAEQAPECGAEKIGVALVVTGGAPVSAIIRAAEDDDIALVVLALHGLPGRHEAGHTALAVAAQLTKPLLVVPPEQPVRRSIRCVLFPLDGTREVSSGVRSLIATYQAAGVEIIALHVFDARTVPRFADGPQDVAIWREQFLAKHCADLGISLETTPGPTTPALLDIARKDDVDVVALGWRQDLGPRHAHVVRQVLTSSDRPVALIPLPHPGQRSDAER